MSDTPIWLDAFAQPACGDPLHRVDLRRGGTVLEPASW